MCAEVRVVQRIRSCECGDLWIIPAVRADDGGCDANLTRLLDDLADFLIVGGDEDHICIRLAQTRQRRLEVLILAQECLGHEHLAAAGGEDLLKDLCEALGIVRRIVEVDDRRLCFQCIEGKLRHDIALLRVDEAAAEDPLLYLTILDRDVHCRCIRGDDGDLVVRRNL